jgi:preprotein translocase subunit YajC
MHANWGTIWNVAQPAGAASPSSGQATEGTAIQGVASGPVAQEAAPGPCGNQSSMTTIIMMVVMFAVFYFLLIRPQQKKAKLHQNMLGGLKKGDEVVTAGGLVGKITGVSDKVLTLEVSEKVRVRVVKSQVTDKYQS